MDSELAAALARIEQRQAAYEVVAHRLIGMLEVHNEKLDAILEAATVEPGPSPTTEVLTADPGHHAASRRRCWRACRTRSARPSATSCSASSRRPSASCEPSRGERALRWRRTRASLSRC